MPLLARLVNKIGMPDEKPTKVPLGGEDTGPKGDVKPSGSQDETPITMTSKSPNPPDSGSDTKTGAGGAKAKATAVPKKDTAAGSSKGDVLEQKKPISKNRASEEKDGVTDKKEKKTREDQQKGKDSTKPKKAKEQEVKKEKKKKKKRKKEKEPKKPHPKVHIKDVPGVVFPQHLGDVFVIMMILALAIGAGAFWFLAWLPTNELPVQEPGENIQQFSEQELQDILKILDAREEASKAPVIPPTRDPFAE